MDIKKLPKTEFASAVAQIAGEKHIEVQEILDSIEAGLISAYKRDQKEKGFIVPDEAIFEVVIAPESGSFAIFQIDGKKRIDVTPPGFGRIAAVTAKNVIDQRIHEAEKDTIMAEYAHKVGTLVQGYILRNDSYRLTVGIGKTEGICPKEEQIRGEVLPLGSKKQFLIKSIHQDTETGRKDIILSRADGEFIKQLFIREVPEVGNRAVTIEAIARDAGARAKVAVSSTQAGVDPVGSCIGQKGIRIQAILNELPQSEKVDVISYSKDKKQFVANALSPASNVKVTSILNGLAVAVVPESDLALAIGSGGENVRLAGILTGLEIKVQGSKK